MAKVTLYQETVLTPEICVKRAGSGEITSINPYLVIDVKKLSGQAYIVYDVVETIEIRPGVFDDEYTYIPIEEDVEFIKGLVEQVKKDTDNLRDKLQTDKRKIILKYDAEDDRNL